MPFGGLPLAEVTSLTWPGPTVGYMRQTTQLLTVYIHSSDIMAATKSAGETSFHRILAAGLNADETHALLATRYRYNSAKVINRVRTIV